ncbi:MAG TPA: DinB family protein [Candidatus Dormibacteraeota bacterium]|nr:DinB family protein [Candidatus Dormibacteraeota bacterium]
MSEDRRELLRHYHQSREALLSAIDGLSEEQLTERSIDGWSVKDHLAHLAFWDDLRAAEVVRISAGHDSAWRLSPEQDETLNQIGYAMRESLPLEQVEWELATSRQRLLDAIAAATPEGLDPARYGEAGLRTGHETEHVEWIRRWRNEKGI